MERDQKQVDKGQEVAMDTFYAGAQQCQTEDELAGYIYMLCNISIKTMYGMEGRKFKKDFLMAALADDQKITPTFAGTTH